MTAYQFSQPWISKLRTNKNDEAMEFAHLRTYLQGIDDGTTSLFNLSALNASIGNLTITGSSTGLAYLPLIGGTMSGVINMGSAKITSMASGTVTGDAINFGQYQNARANILDNGGFEIWQRGTSFSAPASLSYLSDRWFNVTDEATNVTVTKETTTIDSVGLASMKVVVTSTGANHVWYVRQKIENYADYRGKQLSVSIRVNSNIASAIRLEVFDDVSGDNTSSYAGSSGTWETLTASITVSATATAITVQVGMITAGDKKNGTYYFDSAMLIQGSEAVSFVGTNPKVDLGRCQRFYQKSFPIATAPAQNAGVTGAICVKNPIALGDPSVYVDFKVTMRATPTVTTYNPSAANANWRNVTAGSDSTVSVDPATAIGDNGFLIATSGTVTTLGDVLAIHYSATADL